MNPEMLPQNVMVRQSMYPLQGIVNSILSGLAAEFGYTKTLMWDLLADNKTLQLRRVLTINGERLRLGAALVIEEDATIGCLKLFLKDVVMGTLYKFSNQFYEDRYNGVPFEDSSFVSMYVGGKELTNVRLDKIDWDEFFHKSFNEAKKLPTVV